MSVFERIKEFIRRITNKTPQIETLKEKPDGVVAPKGKIEEIESFEIESFAERLKVPENSLLKDSVTFKNLDQKTLGKLAKTIGKLGGKLGWTHSEKPTISGEFNGKSFLSIKRKNVWKGYDGQTICTENGYYDIKTSKINPKMGKYEEHLTLEDGTSTNFYASLGEPDGYVRSVVSRNGISLIEVADLAIMHGDAHEFENFAQPSEELLGEYSKATGLPIIMDSYKIYGDNGLKATTGLDMKDLQWTMEEQESSVIYPYIVSIEVSKQADDAHKSKKKTIKYAYTSPEAYKNGEKPYMIYMDGIDGRTGFSGMFRLKGDSYVDNSTFRRENGKYTYDTISYEEIMKLAGKMPIQLSERTKAAIMGESRMPWGIQKIYDRAIYIEHKNENVKENSSSEEIDLS